MPAWILRKVLGVLESSTLGVFTVLLPHMFGACFRYVRRELGSVTALALCFMWS